MTVLRAAMVVREESRAVLDGQTTSGKADDVLDIRPGERSEVDCLGLRWPLCPPPRSRLEEIRRCIPTVMWLGARVVAKGHCSGVDIAGRTQAAARHFAIEEADV